MKRLLGWLEAHRGVTLLMTGAFFLCTVLVHGRVNEVCHEIQEVVGLRAYNDVLTVVFVLLLLAVLMITARRLLHGADRRAKMAYLVAITGLNVLAYQTLFVLNTEAVHFIQYALLALPLYALTGRFGATMLWGTLLGAIDEAYQYGVIYGDRATYYDFTDLNLNLLGTATGCVLVWILANRPVVQARLTPAGLAREMISPACRPVWILLVAALTGYACGAICRFPGDALWSWSIVLNRGRPSIDPFWSLTDYGKIYHTMSAGEGLLALLVLFTLLLPMDFRLGRPPEPPAPGMNGTA